MLNDNSRDAGCTDTTCAARTPLGEYGADWNDALIFLAAGLGGWAAVTTPVAALSGFMLALGRQHGRWPTAYSGSDDLILLLADLGRTL